MADELAAAGEVVYAAPQASEDDKVLHAAAYVSGAVELLDQAAAAGVSLSHLYVSSLDTTHAGLLLGLRASGSTSSCGRSRPTSGRSSPIARSSRRSRGWSRVRPSCSTSRCASARVDVETSTSHVGERYGVLTTDGVEALRLFARTEAIVLDPVYSAKAAAALIADVRSGVLDPGDTVVFWHTGGLPALFAYADAIGPLVARPADPARR